MFKEQKLVLSKLDSFELKDIFECGQCFRWNKQEDGSYIGVISSGVLRVYKNKNDVIFEGLLEGDINSIVYHYFDLATNYKEFKLTLATADDNMKKAISYGGGIRILNQDLWEMVISYIISANNNIPRIKGIIERISQKCGRKISWKGNEYYLFPTVEELSTLSVGDLRALGTGFRDKRIYNTTQMILRREIDFKKLRKIQDLDELREELLKLDGVGNKVADCIMLFALHRFDSFPVDVWVRRVMNLLYIKAKDEKEVSKKQIKEKADELFGNICGLAQQYLFYWARENVK